MHFYQHFFFPESIYLSIISFLFSDSGTTTKMTTGVITASSAAPVTCTSRWSQWINTDSPMTGDGDLEVPCNCYNLQPLIKQSRVLMIIMKKHIESIVEKGQNSRNQDFSFSCNLLYPTHVLAELKLWSANVIFFSCFNPFPKDKF